MQKNSIILADIELNAYFCSRKVKIEEIAYDDERRSIAPL